MPAAPNDILRITVDAVHDTGDVFQNVFHFKHGGSQNHSNAAILSAVNDWIEETYDDWAIHMANDVTIASFRVFNVTTNAPIGEQNVDNPVTGALTVPQLPTQACALLNFTTNTAKSLGKKFLMGLASESTSDGNTIDGQTLIAMGIVAVNMLQGFLVGDDPYDAGNWNKTKQRFAPWVTAIAKSGIFTQRRRRLGAGE